MTWIKESVDYGIIGLLFLLSVIAIAVAIERFLVYRRINVGHFSAKKELEIILSEKLHLIATIGSNAPYIGLLGTVLSIMLTFHTMGQDGFADTGKIMTGLALALKATAVGLVVAIPSTAIYNLLLRKAKVLLMQWEVSHG
jgi:biopolymer transport protein ExbB